MMRIQILTLLELNRVFLNILGLGSVLFLTACAGGINGVNEDIAWENSKVYEVKDCTMEGSCFFQYPESALISERGGLIRISYDDCNISFGKKTPALKDGYVLKESESGSRHKEEWFNEKILIGYFIGFIDSRDYKFWLYDNGQDISKCVSLVDEIADSFTDRPVFTSDKFSFSATVLSNYNVEYLQNEEGIVMRRTVSGEELKRIYDLELENWPMSAKGGPDDSPYEVVIGITAMKNLMGYKDLGEYLKSECADCTLEFTKKGVFVGEDKGSYSERVFLAMSEDKDILYRAFLRLPRYRFKYHQKWFDEWVNSIEFF